MRVRRHAEAAELAAAGRTEEAIGLYLELQRDDRADLAAFAALRDIYGRLGRKAELADQWRLLAEVRLGSGRALDAERCLERAVVLDPDRGELREQLAEHVVRHGGFGSPRTLFRKAARAFAKAGDDPGFWRMLHRSEQVCGDVYGVLRACLERLERNDADQGAAAQLDGAYRDLGWISNAADRRAAEVRELLRSHGPRLAAQHHDSLVKLGGLLEEGFYRELAERCEQEALGPELAEQMLGFAERARLEKRFVH
jgi:predicted Zn-dependent protease